MRSTRSGVGCCMREQEDVAGVGEPPIASVQPANASRIVDGLGADGRDQLVDAYDTWCTELLAGGGPLEPTRSPLLQAAHERRLALLGSLPVGDLSSKVCVDYG